jgi:Fic family protein
VNSHDFVQHAPGKLVTATSGGLAFSPNPLPPEIEISWELANQLSKADRALSELAGEARRLPNPNLLIQPFINKEAQLSSKIEGTITSMSELYFSEVTPKYSKRVQEILEVRNYITALEFGLDSLTKIPVSIRLIRNIHNKLMRNVRGATHKPGHFREDQNWELPSIGV